MKEMKERRLLRCLMLIKSMMDVTEANGIGVLKSHSGLTKGELINLSFTNDVTKGLRVPNKIELKLSSNTTIYSLRYKIGRRFLCSWDALKLIQLDTRTEISMDDNGRTIGELRFKNAEIFAVRIAT